MRPLWLPKKGIWLPKRHHSTGDWDFEDTGWYLDTGTYVSSPSSLRLGSNYGALSPQSVLCTDGDTLSIDEGRIVSWIFGGDLGNGRPIFVFRSQAAVGSPSSNDCYFVLFGDSEQYWYYRDSGGTNYEVGHWGESLLDSTWYKVRITWWNGKNLQNVDATVCRFEKWEAGGWTQVGDDKYDTNERNKGSAINRVGVGWYGTAIYYALFDDTEIWCTGA